MKRITISLPDDLSDLLDTEARDRHTSVSEVVRQAIVLGLSGPPAGREVPFAGLFHDPGMVSGADLEAELAGSWADDLDRDRR